jgi:hypothetical protein
MTVLRKRLSHEQYLALNNQLISMAIDGRIDLRAKELAEKLTPVLEFEVGEKVVRTAAKARGIDLIRNMKRDNGSRSDEVQQDFIKLDEISSLILRLEGKVDRLCKELGVKWVDLE